MDLMRLRVVVGLLAVTALSLPAGASGEAPVADLSGTVYLPNGRPARAGLGQVADAWDTACWPAASVV